MERTESNDAVSPSSRKANVRDRSLDGLETTVDRGEHRREPRRSSCAQVADGERPVVLWPILPIGGIEIVGLVVT